MHLILNVLYCFRTQDVSVSKQLLGPEPFANLYKMDHSKRGVAIIFNQMHFSIPNCSPREGTNKDRDDLEALFKKLGFDVLVHNDATISEIRAVLKLGDALNIGRKKAT